MSTTTTQRSRTGRLAAVATGAGALALALTACGGGGFDEDASNGDASAPAEGGTGAISVLIGTSGEAETASVQAAIDAWEAESGFTAELRVASDLPQQLAQGFAANTPPDVFYVASEAFPGMAEAGNLWAYGDQLDAEFHESLREQFTFDGSFYAAPKDFSTLALAINDDAWAAAGLTEADFPTTWEELADVAQQLTTDGQVGLSFGPEWQRIGTFMAQAGGALVDDEGNAVVDSDANVQALDFVKELLASGSTAFPSAIGAGWGGEALGNGAAAMVIEGNWIAGAMANDFPDRNYTVVPLPEGPGGAGTLQFTTGWGIAELSQNKEAALSFVQFMVSDAQQMQFARDFGVMPSVTTVADQWAEEFPEAAAFVRGGSHAQGFPAVNGIAAVISDFNAQIEGLSTADSATVLQSVQRSLEEILP